MMMNDGDQQGQEECLIDFKGFEFDEEFGGDGEEQQHFGAANATAIERARKKAEKLTRGFEKLMLGTDRNANNGRQQQSEQIRGLQAKKT